MGGRAPPRETSRCSLQDLVGPLRFSQLSPQPTVLRFQVDRLGRGGFAGILVLAHPDSQGLFTQAELVRDTGDRSVRGVRIGLGMDDERDGTSLEFVGVFPWQERISFFQSPCLYYPRGDSFFLPLFEVASANEVHEPDEQNNPDGRGPPVGHGRDSTKQHSEKPFEEMPNRC